MINIEGINKLGFGLLRLPEKNTGKSNDYDWELLNKMVDSYLEQGGYWFDTCYTYLDGFSEEAVRRCVAQRKPRKSFGVIEKLPGYDCRSYADCQKFFDKELQRCGVDYFDVFMLHWLDGNNYKIAEKYDEFRFLREKKSEGKAVRIGFSYHGDADLLEEILAAHPEVEVVLLQINYLDWDSRGIESGRCYETALAHGVSVFVMEPVKGGTLSKLPEEANHILQKIHSDWSPSDWALRFVQSLPGVELCLSGMNSLQQVTDNMKPFRPLEHHELEALSHVAEIIRADTRVACTGCRYCLRHCPQQIAIPEYFSLLNEVSRYPEDGWKISPVFNQIAMQSGKPSDCIGCGNCEENCPQNIAIREYLQAAAKEFE